MAGLPELALNRALFSAGDRVCVAVSGGADSVALLLALIEANRESRLNKTPLGVVLSAVHVNHGLRGAESEADAAFVAELCERLSVPLTVERVDTAGRQAVEREGVEEAARELRYGAFARLMESGAASVVATAHTLDDQAETVMMKLLRGAWTEGLGGIAPLVAAEQQNSRTAEQQNREGRRRIVRPLLGVRRVEIEAYLLARGQAWRTDSSNADVTLTRNRVRHELMPLLRSFNPAVDVQLARVAEIARDEEAYWQGEVARLLPQLLLPGRPVRGGGRAVSTGVGEAGCAMEIERLRPLAPAMRRRLVRAAARTLGARMSAVETAKVLALAGMGQPGEPAGKPGARLELANGLRVERTVRELQFAVVGTG
ncbi:tRNA lysidine(34) synthetase TilS [Bryocella elongata]|uniref:tRNA lysidine(34) synthetase TilS n=1 Tax=Bryocella elongata TaxID=863522 RepID=UPI001F430C88|nr:tRNA lysidine(34) synthetase TilS [Bryocella elongata]